MHEPTALGTYPTGRGNAPLTTFGWPALIWILMAGIFTARWLWLAGMGDYGWTYEAAWRIAHGQVQYVDFISSLPPLANYTLALVLRCGGDSLWWYHLHLYLWWYAALLAGYRLARQGGISAGLLGWVGLFTVTISNPAGTLGHAYNYAATALAGLAIWLLARQRRRLIEVVASGVASGLCVFAKQNVGLALLVAAGAVLVLRRWSPESPEQPDWSVVWFGLGAALVLLPVSLYFSTQAGWREFSSQLFTDGAAGKGGLVAVLARAVPRLIFEPGTPHRRFVELALSAPLFGLVGWIYWRVWCSRSGETVGGTTQSATGASIRWTGLFFACLVVLSVISLARWSPANALKHMLSCPYITSWTNVLVFGTYLCAVVGYGLAIVAMWAHPRNGLVAVLAATVLVGSATSSLTYLTSAAPVVLPVLLALLESLRLPRLERFVGWGAYLVLGFFFISPTYNRTFDPLVRLAGGTPYAGLRAEVGYGRFVAALTSQVSPRIKGRATLWLLNGGPHAAFGGKPVKNVVSLYKDTYHSRQEPLLESEWTQHPPEFVVTGPFGRANGARFLSESGLQVWLASSYDCVWQESEFGLALWQRRK